MMLIVTMFLVKKKLHCKTEYQCGFFKICFFRGGGGGGGVIINSIAHLLFLNAFNDEIVFKNRKIITFIFAISFNKPSSEQSKLC